MGVVRGNGQVANLTYGRRRIGKWSSSKLDLQQVGLAEEEGEGGGAVFDLVGLGHVQDFGDRFVVDFGDFGRFRRGLAQFDVLGEEDIADFVADA